MAKTRNDMKKIDQEVLNNMAAGINSVPCPLCGGAHRVNLSLNETHSFAQSSADWLVMPSGNKVFVEIEDGACDGFRERLSRFLADKLFFM